MCRSSRLLMLVGCLAAISAAGPASAQGRMGVAPAAPISPGMPRTGVRQGVMPGVNRSVAPNVRPNVAPNVRPNIAPNVRRNILPGFNRGLAYGGLRGRGIRRLGYGGSALGLAGLGLSLADDVPYPIPEGVGLGEGVGPNEDGGPYGPQVIPAYVPPQPCLRPLIISVGNGLRRKAKTRVIYGRESYCGR